ncbi:MAG: hypothetical protein IJF67_04200 [Clostridia bacterium]|nr:hypothetical protein [Clostridia bacterium]
MKKRTLSILLLMALLASTACGGTAAGADTTAASGDTTSAAPVTEAEIISKDLPEKDFGGHEFKFLTIDKEQAGYLCYELDADSQNGDIMNDAVYERNTAVEEKYNIKISKEVSSDYMNMFKSAVLAGEDTWDVLDANAMAVAQNSVDYGLSADDLPYIDLSRDWWDLEVIENSALGGKNYALSGDINLVDDDSLWVIYFNKRLAEEYKVGDLYKMVWDGKWTMDNFKKLSAGATSDINGDGTLDYNDQWGFVASSNHALSMLWAGGGSLASLNKDGTLELTLDSARNIDVFTKIYDIFAAKDSVMVIDRDIPSKVGDFTNYTYSYTMFGEGRSLFFGYTLYVLPNFRDMEDEFGYLPCPKYDEAQKDYASIMQSWVGTALLVPKSASDPERTSIILEAMASSAKHYITPAYYDVVLTRKYSRDDESSAIIDLLRNNRQFDLAYTYNFGGVRNMNKVLIADSNTVASSIASMKDAAQAAYETTYQAILDGME